MAHRDATSLVFSGTPSLTLQDVEAKYAGISPDKRIGRLENWERLEIGALDMLMGEVRNGPYRSLPPNIALIETYIPLPDTCKRIIIGLLKSEHLAEEIIGKDAGKPRYRSLLEIVPDLITDAKFKSEIRSTGDKTGALLVQEEAHFIRNAWSEVAVEKVLDNLGLAELQKVAKERKLIVKPQAKGTSSDAKKRFLIAELLRSTRTQAVLRFSPVKQGDDNLISSRDSVLRKQAIEEHCSAECLRIRLNPEFQDLLYQVVTIAERRVKNPRPSEILLPAMYRILHEATPDLLFPPITIKPPDEPLWLDQPDFLAFRRAQQAENLGIHLVSHHSTCATPKARGKGKKKEVLDDADVGQQLSEMVHTSAQRLRECMKSAHDRFMMQRAPPISEHLEAGSVYARLLLDASKLSIISDELKAECLDALQGQSRWLQSHWWQWKHQTVKAEVLYIELKELFPWPTLPLVYHAGFVRFIREYEKQTNCTDKLEGLILAPSSCTKATIYVEPAKSEIDADYKFKHDKAIRAYFLDRGFHGVVISPTIILTLFGLLFKDQIYATYPGAFSSKSQIAPYDIGCLMALRGKDFRPRLASVTDGSITTVLNDDEFWNPLLTIVGVDYVNNTEEDVRHLIRYMDKQALAGVCKLLAEDYLHRLEGIPEVIAYRRDGTKTAFGVIAKKDGSEAQQQQMWLEALQMAPGVKLTTQEEVKAYRRSTQTTIITITQTKPKQLRKRKDSADYTSGDDNEGAPLSPPAKRTRRSTKISESN